MDFYFVSSSILGFEMDLENYESDLADLTLQDSPFYEASTPMIFDLSMSSTNGAMLTGVTVTGGKLSGKGASTSSSMAHHGDNQQNNNTLANPINLPNCNDAGNYGYTPMYNNGPPKKKNRKCVSFLPNYIQVSGIYFKIHVIS